MRLQIVIRDVEACMQFEPRQFIDSILPMAHLK
jgi:hypothetical protein